MKFVPLACFFPTAAVGRFSAFCLNLNKIIACGSSKDV